MSIKANHPPDGPNPTPVPTAVRWKIMSRVKSFFRTTPTFDELTERFDELLEHRDRTVALNSGIETDAVAAEHPVLSEIPGSEAPRCQGGRSGAKSEENDARPDEDCSDDEGGIDGPCERLEGRIIVLTGETGSGKTQALDRLFWLNRARLGDSLISILAPSPCTLKQLGRDLLPKLGYPLVRDKEEHLVWEDVHRRLEGRKGLIIHFDEFQRLTQRANIAQQQKILDTINSLVQRRDNPVQLILSGTCVLADFIRTDWQVARRCRFVELGRLDTRFDVLPVACTIEELVERTPLKIDESVANDVAARLIHATNYALGRSIELACEAIEVALRAGDAMLTHPHFEKALSNRISCPRARNPFVVDNWTEIDPTLILNRETTEPDTVQPRNRSRSRRAGNGRS